MTRVLISPTLSSRATPSRWRFEPSISLSTKATDSSARQSNASSSSLERPLRRSPGSRRRSLMQSRGRDESWTSETSSLTRMQPSTTLSCGRLSSMMCQCFAANALRSSNGSPPQTMRPNAWHAADALRAPLMPSVRPRRGRTRLRSERRPLRRHPPLQRTRVHCALGRVVAARVQGRDRGVPPLR